MGQRHLYDHRGMFGWGRALLLRARCPKLPQHQRRPRRNTLSRLSLHPLLICKHHSRKVMPPQLPLPCLSLPIDTPVTALAESVVWAVVALISNGAGTAVVGCRMRLAVVEMVLSYCLETRKEFRVAAVDGCRA